MSDEIEFYTSKMDDEKLISQNFSLPPQLSKRLRFNDPPISEHSCIKNRPKCTVDVLLKTQAKSKEKHGVGPYAEVDYDLTQS